MEIRWLEFNEQTKTFRFLTRKPIFDLSTIVYKKSVEVEKLSDD